MSQSVPGVEEAVGVLENVLALIDVVERTVAVESSVLIGVVAEAGCADTLQLEAATVCSESANVTTLHDLAVRVVVTVQVSSVGADAARDALTVLQVRAGDLSVRNKSAWSTDARASPIHTLQASVVVGGLMNAVEAAALRDASVVFETAILNVFANDCLTIGADGVSSVRSLRVCFEVIERRSLRAVGAAAPGAT